MWKGGSIGAFERRDCLVDCFQSRVLLHCGTCGAECCCRLGVKGRAIGEGRNVSSSDVYPSENLHIGRHCVGLEDVAVGFGIYDRGETLGDLG